MSINVLAPTPPVSDFTRAGSGIDVYGSAILPKKQGLTKYVASKSELV